MAKRPLLLFPKATVTSLPKGKGFPPSHPHTPDFNKQKKRLAPQFNQLKQAFENERAVLSDSTSGLTPELVIVIETVGSINNFQQAVRAIDGLEWLAEWDIEPDIEEGFYIEKKGEVTDKKLSGRLFLTMSNQRAMDELLSLWDKWDSPKKTFLHGFSKWKEIFKNIKTIRRWDTQDRLIDTGVLESWKEDLEFFKGTASKISFEIELWYQKSSDKRRKIQDHLLKMIHDEGGEVIGAPCIIEDIHFHAIKADLPADVIKKVLNKDYTELFKNNNVWSFWPMGQCIVSNTDETETFAKNTDPPVSGDPVLAILDGMPFIQHELIKDRIILDDPDDWASYYQANEFRHGTAMVSLVSYGELDADETPLTRPVYIRPIMQPNANARSFGRFEEHIPDDIFPEDLLERSVKRLFEGENGLPPIAPTVKIINLSICNLSRPFINTLSPWAKVLDWLSWKYKVLFCVSAGNHMQNVSIGMDESTFKNLSPSEKLQASLKSIDEDSRNRRLLSPAESINAITVGAIHNDDSLPLNDNRIDIIPNKSLPSPISAQGHGFRHSISPDIFLKGGRQFYSYQFGQNGQYKTSLSGLPPGQRVASIGKNPGELNRTTFVRGTSNATALASRGAAMLYEVIDEIRMQYPDKTINDEHIAPLIKALLVHSTSWENSFEALEDCLKNPNNSKNFKRFAARYLGYGMANIERVLECTEQRATVIGSGIIEKGNVHNFHFPLPPSLRGSNEKRRLIITLAWITPINPGHRNFRLASLSFNPPKENEHLAVKRQEADGQQVKKGTVQHEILEGDKVSDYTDDDNLVIPVTCKEDAGDLNEAIPYGIAVTLEVAESVDIHIYQEIQERIRMLVRVKNT